MVDFDNETYKDFPVGIKIYVEHRANSRVSITQKNVIVRLPKHLSEVEKTKRLKEHLDWAKDVINNKNLFLNKKKSIADYHHQTIKIYGYDFFIKVIKIETGRNKLSYKGNGNIEIYLKYLHNESDNVQIIKSYLSKFTTRFFLNKITEDTLRLNQLHFQETIKSVRLDLALTKWGSCSSKRSIMFSTRLLLLPPKAIEYVIIHELAHLKEMNHSKKFWQWVESAMPDYKYWDKWLSKEGSKYHF